MSSKQGDIRLIFKIKYDFVIYVHRTVLLSKQILISCLLLATMCVVFFYINFYHYFSYKLLQFIFGIYCQFTLI